MNVVVIDESNCDREYQESTSAIKDFLYMLFEIAGDRLPLGDWDRADLGAVDPFRYLDIAYEDEYQFRSVPELDFLHRAAALNLLCRLAEIEDEDECSGSTWMADFQNPLVRAEKETSIREHHPVMFRILEAFESGRIVSIPVIQQAFTAALYGNGDFLQALANVTSEIVVRPFDDL